MTNRKLAALETRNELLEAAKKIIREKGLAHTSVAEITRECGVASGTFYTYFKRKEDILFALSGEVFREILEKAELLTGTFMERLSFYMENFSRYIEKSGLKLCQEWVRNTVDPDLVDDPEQKGKLQADIAALENLIGGAVKKGELKPRTPTTLLARHLTDILYGQMLCWDMSGGAYRFEERTKEFCAEFLGAMMQPWLAKRTVRSASKKPTGKGEGALYGIRDEKTKSEARRPR